MPDILGATNPVPGYDSASANRNIPVSPNNTQIQNVPDPTRVTRSDGRTEQQDSGAQGDGVRYDSNFQTFLQRLRNTPGMAQSLSRILSGREGTVVLSGMSEGIAQEMSQILEMLQMDESQLLDFLSGQVRANTLFSGALFALLRNAYARASSDGVRTDILQFLRNYADFASTSHLEGNMLRNLHSMADAMPASWAERLRDMIGQLENGVMAGDRAGNLELLQKGVFPYMGNYVERTHDLGLPRTLLSMLALNMARYENGSEANLLESFHQLAGYGTLKNQLGGIDDKALLNLLRSNQQGQESRAIQFSNHLTAAAAAALRGEGSAEIQQAFQNLMSALLINESVYMPINHYLIPLQWEGRMLFSELWVDPNADEGRNGGGGGGERTMRFLFKMDVQSLGLFDVVLTTRGADVDLQIACPDKAVPFARQIETEVSKILVRNDLKPSSVTVRKMERPVTLTEVFPKIFEGMNSVNVKV